jgi:hypothetical protein
VKATLQPIPSVLAGGSANYQPEQRVAQLFRGFKHRPYTKTGSSRRQGRKGGIALISRNAWHHAPNEPFVNQGER